MKRKWLALTTVGIWMHLLAAAQQPLLGLESYFEEAYWRYPNVPKGLLEASAYAASRMTNLQPVAGETTGCTGMPQRYGLYALVKDGKGYFKSNLLTVCDNSGITPEQYNNDVRLQVLAVAKFLSREASIQQLEVPVSVEGFAGIFDKLTEIPDDSSVINKYALALFKYEIYDQLRSGFSTPSLKRAPVKVQMEQLFPAPLLKQLQCGSVDIRVAVDSIPGDNTAIYATNIITPAAPVATGEAVTTSKADYSPALYVAAHTGNFQPGRNGAAISSIAIHTTQGSYAATVSWFNNPAAHTATHYIVRASDGQVTQMVREDDMALHLHSSNAITIGIAHEGYAEHGNKWYSDKQYRSSAALVRDICARQNIDEAACFKGATVAGMHIKGHQHYTGNTQSDPGKYWNWTKYAALLTEQYTPDTEKEIRFVTVPNGVYRITNVNSKKVLNTKACSGAALAKVTQTTWSGKDCERWQFEYAGEGWYRITNAASGRALEIPGGTKENVQVHLKDIKDNNSQLWRLLESGNNGQLRLVNKASNKVLEVFGGSASNGAAVLQTAYTGQRKQQWTIAEASVNEEADEVRRFQRVNLD